MFYFAADCGGHGNAPFIDNAYVNDHGWLGGKYVISYGCNVGYIDNNNNANALAVCETGEWTLPIMHCRPEASKCRLNYKRNAKKKFFKYFGQMYAS